MNDLDRLLKESLNAVRDSYAEHRQEDRFETRARFIERARRRRTIFTAASVAVAGAALVAGVLFAGGGLDFFASEEPPSELAGKLPKGVVSAVVTGPEPVDSGIRTGGVWVANSGDSTISHVDQGSDRVIGTISLDGPPQEVDVGLGQIWVAGFGRVTAIDPRTDEISDSTEVGDVGDTISISVGEGYIWTVVANDRLVRVDPNTLEVEEIPAVTAPADVAARDGSVWVLDADQGLVQLDPVTGEVTSAPSSAVPRSGDISAGGGVVWIASRESNTVVRFPAEGSGAPGFFEVDGTYLDMAVSEAVVWVLSRPNGHALLTALDPQTSNQLGKPLRLTGDPVEVSSGQGGVWVVARGSGALFRIDPGAVDR